MHQHCDEHQTTYFIKYIHVLFQLILIENCHKLHLGWVYVLTRDLIPPFACTYIDSSTEYILVETDSSHAVNYTLESEQISRQFAKNVLELLLLL